MKDLEAKYTRRDVEVTRDELVYDGFFKMHAVRLKHRLFAGGWTNEIKREIFHRGEAAAAILYDPRNDLIGLVEQFRIGALESERSPWCLEVVAGMVESDELPEDVVRREILEEAGVDNAEIIPISHYYSTPGGCSEKVYLYCALCDLSDSGGIHGLDHENEDILLHIVPAAEVFPVMLDSRMNNAATLIGLQWLQLNRESIKLKLGQG